ncbi:hypothetical protein ACLOJK_006739, partial [Asimina triloba]
MGLGHVVQDNAVIGVIGIFEEESGARACVYDSLFTEMGATLGRSRRQPDDACSAT